MNIGQILKVNQIDIYNKLDKQYGLNKSKIDTKDKVSKRDIEDLMSNRAYKRGKGGAIKQVR